MKIISRGFGANHHNPDGSTSIASEEEYEHIASILSIVITGATVVGAIFIVTRTIKVITASHAKRKATRTDAMHPDPRRL
jgi:hypothetical protein